MREPHIDLKEETRIHVLSGGRKLKAYGRPPALMAPTGHTVGYGGPGRYFSEFMATPCHTPM
jgi:hypothetical protein